MYCRVIVDIVHENVAHTFTYSIPEGMTVERGQRVAVPFGRTEKEGIVTELCDQPDFDPARVKPLLRKLEDYPALLPQILDLAEEMAGKAHCPLAETLRLMIPAQMRGGRISVKTAAAVRSLLTAEETEKAISEEKRSEKKRKLLRLLSDGRVHLVRDLEEEVRSPGEILKKMAADGLVGLEKVEQYRTPWSAAVQEAPKVLTDEQQEVLEEILPCLLKGEGRFLLHGVTGSGKTEVFMAAVRKTLEIGKSAIILVPEISLTPQMVSWFRARFGSVAAVIHSRLSAGERFDEWRRIRLGEARVVIGARSAIFAPAERLGLVVVDEEHENTYINDRHPRYDAREVALSRCRREGAALILASATPSVLSFARALRGDYMLLEMPRRVLGRPLPEVTVVDMRRELENGNRSIFSAEMRNALLVCRERNEQAMLLMNRRGYHSFVSCRSCGYVVKCPNCDVSMTYHLNEEDGVLRCHYCGQTLPLPSNCPACGSRYIKLFGAGTQKVEEEIHRLLPGVPTARMDIDTTGGKDGHARILEEFRSGKARVLIGTQMIAKGLDFPGVTLVGVVAADQTLHLPDYRSRERTFQLLTQVAGRAGRGTIPGRVIIQTYMPEDPVIGFAAKQDYRAFFEDEFRRRRRSLYPPFTIMARLLVEAGDEETAVNTADRLEADIRGLIGSHPAWQKKILLVMNDAAPVRILRGRYRRHILIKLLIGAEAEEFCGHLSEMAEIPREDADIYFEYNPSTMI